MNARLIPAALALAFAALHANAATDLAPEHVADGREWVFTALLDGKPIGEHRFSVKASGDERQLTSDARFDVKFLGFSAYRYRHQATEHWRGDCLDRISANTDDNGKPFTVKGERSGDALQVKASAGAETLPGCVMSFAYWNPAILKQTKLLNAQTGKLEPVRIARVGTTPVEVRGKTVQAVAWHISGPDSPIDVLLSPEGEWIGLDSTVAGNRRLTYRLP